MDPCDTPNSGVAVLEFVFNIHSKTSIGKVALKPHY